MPRTKSADRPPPSGRSLNLAMRAIEGQRCWGIVAGRGTGSMFTMGIGRKIRMARPLTNPHLTETQRKFDAEFGFYVLGSAWRIHHGDEITCTWNVWCESVDAMVRGIRRLVGKRVVRARAIAPAFDLEVTFEAGWKLVVFCDMPPGSDDDCYTFHDPAGTFGVGGNGLVTWEAHDV